MSAAMRPLVVTRPQPEAQQWVMHLQAQGVAAQAMPMMAIGPSTQPASQQAVATALQQLADFQAIMFVSGNAVRYFWHHLQTTHRHIANHTRLWAPGPGTVRALLDCGAPACHIDQPAADAQQFDSEALWQVVQPQVQPGHQILLVRGGDAQSPSCGKGRQWLSDALAERGARVHYAPVYERKAPDCTPELHQSITQLLQHNALWLFSSSECLLHLQQCAPDANWSTATALATHPRIAQQARQIGFGRAIDTKPTVQDIVASIKSLHDL